MSLSSLAGFYRATGRPVELLEGGLWVAETGLSVMAIPGVVGLRPRLQELNAMLRRMRRIAALFAVEPGTGVNVSRFVLRDRSYGLHSLQRQFRQQTRAAMGVCEVRPVEWSEMVRKGLPAYRDSQLRRGRRSAWIGTKPDGPPTARLPEAWRDWRFPGASPATGNSPLTWSPGPTSASATDSSSTGRMPSRPCIPPMPFTLKRPASAWDGVASTSFRWAGRRCRRWRRWISSRNTPASIGSRVRWRSCCILGRDGAL